MVKGTEKRVIYLKDPESDLIESAFFLVKSLPREGRVKESDIVREATRILYEGEQDGMATLSKKERGDGIARLLFLFLGFFLGILVMALLLLL